MALAAQKRSPGEGTEAGLFESRPAAAASGPSTSSSSRVRQGPRPRPASYERRASPRRIASSKTCNARRCTPSPVRMARTGRRGHDADPSGSCRRGGSRRIHSEGSARDGGPYLFREISHDRQRRRFGAPPWLRGRGGLPPLSPNGRRQGRYWLVGERATRLDVRCRSG